MWDTVPSASSRRVKLKGNHPPGQMQAYAISWGVTAAIACWELNVTYQCKYFQKPKEYILCMLWLLQVVSVYTSLRCRLNLPALPCICWQPKIQNDDHIALSYLYTDSLQLAAKVIPESQLRGKVNPNASWEPKSFLRASWKPKQFLRISWEPKSFLRASWEPKSFLSASWKQSY